MSWIETIRLLAAKSRIDDLVSRLPSLLAAWDDGHLEPEDGDSKQHQQRRDRRARPGADTDARRPMHPATAGPRSMAVYRQQSADADLLVCLWREPGDVPGKSREGLLLADYLSEFGLVDHAVWEEHCRLSASATPGAPPRPPDGTGNRAPALAAAAPPRPPDGTGNRAPTLATTGPPAPRSAVTGPKSTASPTTNSPPRQAAVSGTRRPARLAPEPQGSPDSAAALATARAPKPAPARQRGTKP
jgi:hypothetical protein